MLSLIHNTTYWAQAMFGTAQIGDNCRIERLVDIVSRLTDNTGRSEAYACDSQGCLVESTYWHLLFYSQREDLRQRFSSGRV